MEIDPGIYLNALLLLAIIGGVLGVGFKAINNNNKKKE